MHICIVIVIVVFLLLFAPPGEGASAGGLISGAEPGGPGLSPGWFRL